MALGSTRKTATANKAFQRRHSMEMVRGGQMKALERLLLRLHRVAEIGEGQYKASCPTPIHSKGDRSRGLSITELDDGRLLVHCYAGCAAAAITESVGLNLSDLFPDTPDLKRRNHRTLPRDAIKTCYHEIMVICVAVGRVKCLSPEEVIRVQEAGRNVEQILRRAL